MVGVATMFLSLQKTSYMRILTFVLALGLFAACSSQNKNTTDQELLDLYGLMQGSFNSAEQALTDSAFFDITLHMYPIWEGKEHYLYVEQSVSSMQDRPYRQRIYQLKRTSDSAITSYIYKIPNDSLWIGAWKNADSFNALNPTDLISLNGCEVILSAVGTNHYKGSTGEKSCESTLYGASYAHSAVEISEGTIYSWDRGLDADGKQIWGAVKGGYIFKKLSE